MNVDQMIELPDGSGCFIATIMSKEEAMTLPLNKRPLCFRISSEMYHAVFEEVGAASMCWKPDTGQSVFKSEAASEIAVKLCFQIANEIESVKHETLEWAKKQIVLDGNPECAIERIEQAIREI